MFELADESKDLTGQRINLLCNWHPVMTETEDWIYTIDATKVFMWSDVELIECDWKDKILDQILYQETSDKKTEKELLVSWKLDLE